jgi:hypothetical protein
MLKAKPYKSSIMSYYNILLKLLSNMGGKMRRGCPQKGAVGGVGVGVGGAR